jgi:predicted amidophosphoribosyltransferase
MPVPLLRTLLDDAIELLLPEQCVVCGRFGAAIHPECRADLEAAAPPRCAVCWAPGAASPCAACREAPPAFAGLRAPYRFTGAVHRAVLEAKFRGVTGLLAPLAEAAAAVVPAEWGVDLVVPVPLHPRRERETRAQATLGAGQRTRNLGGAFASAAVSGTVLVVDDVTTTGATF